MMGNWWRLFARERTSVPQALRMPASKKERAPEAVAVSHGVVSGDDIEECFLRFILNLPILADDAATLAREQAALLRLRELCDNDRFDVRSMPRMPSVLPQLMRAMKNDKLSGAQLAELIRRDPVLVGEVMRVTGSVTYRTAHPIGSLQHAVVLLGQIGLRHVVSAYVMKPILVASAGSNGQIVGQRLWDHAERCAHAAVFLSKGQCDPFEAYLTGLVGYSGLGAVARMLDREMSGTLTACSPAFIAACRQLAAQLTVQVGQHWDLPPVALEALTEHATVSSLDMTQPMSRVLHAAQRLAMCQLLAENGLVDGAADYTDGSITQFPSMLLARCRQDLQKNFATP